MKYLPILAMMIFALPLSGQETATDDPAKEKAAVTESATEESPADESATEQTTPDDSATTDATTDATTETSDTDTTSDTAEQAADSETGLVENAKDRVNELAKSLDKNRTVQQASSGILNPIYTVAEKLAFPAFYWLAFGLMVAGVVNFVFQLVPGKLIVLIKGSINIREILSDIAGLLISAIGLVLTTQAATENSTFPESPTSVLSAAAVGLVLGLILFRWNQAEEINAVRGRNKK